MKSKKKIISQLVHGFSLLVGLYLIFQTVKNELSDGDWIILAIPYLILVVLEIGWFIKPKIFKLPVLIVWIVFFFLSALTGLYLINEYSIMTLLMMLGILFLG